MKKQVWFDARNINRDDQIILPLIANSVIEYMVVKAEDRAEYKMPRKTKYVVYIENESHLEKLQEHDIAMSESEELLEMANAKGHRTSIYVTVNDRNALDYACKVSGKHNFAVIKFDSETNIPLELLIASLQNTVTVLFKQVSKAIDGKIAFGVMEEGAGGVLLSTEDIEEIVAMNQMIQNTESIKLKLVPGKVKSVEHVAMGYRACIDTTSLLNKNEGMLIGSFSRGGILVSSEMHYLPYMNLRPFRVNAGAVHSYVWCPDNTTEYLTDLKSGSSVLAIDHEGNAREVTVGRVKIEARPLLKVVVEAEGQLINTIVQDDWHIRLLGINGEPYNASCIVEGTILATYVCESGRHVGIKIDETITEQ